MSLSTSARLALTSVIALSMVACGKSSKPAESRKKDVPKDNRYEFGQVVGFGWNAKSGRYKRGGWGETEEHMTWTTAGNARLTFTLAESNQPLRLRMRLTAFTFPPAIQFQPVQVLVNDEDVAFWQVTSDVDDYVALIPPDVADHQQLIVELRMARATSPKVLEVSDDPRMLGVGCFELSIVETTSAAAMAERRVNPGAVLVEDEYAYNTMIKFGRGAGSQRYKKSGWHIAEDLYTWTGREPAVLGLTIPPSECPLVLKMKLSAMMKPRDLPVQPTDVYLNGQWLARWEVRGWEVFEVAIPAEIGAQGGEIRVELQTPRAASAEALGTGSDKRVLGVRCEAMIISDEQEMVMGSTPSPEPSSRGRGRKR